MSATERHWWVVDYEPVTDAPVEAGSGEATPRSVSEDEADEVGENRNGLAIVITDGQRRLEVGRVAFRAELAPKGKSRFEHKLRAIEVQVAQPACDARNAAEVRLARARHEANEALVQARESHSRRVREAQEELRRIEFEVIKPWDGDASGSDEDEDED